MKLCHRGHPRTPENLYRNGQCRACVRERERLRREEARAARVLPPKPEPPLPAVQPVEAYALSPEALAEERAAARQRREAKATEVLARIRTPESMDEHRARFGFTCGRGARDWRERDQ